LVRGKRLDQDFLGQLRTNAKTNIANLADNIRFLAEQSYFLFFAKSHFAKSVSDFRRGGQLFDPDGCSCLNLRQRTNKWLGATLHEVRRRRIMTHAAKIG